MKILFFTDNFPPESNAPATRTYEHCIEWVKKGADVTVITCTPNYPKGEVFPGFKNKWKQEEMMDGIRVIRVWSYISPNRGLVKRILDYLSFCFTSFIASLFVKTDIIIATSPQLFTALSGCASSIVKRKPWILEIRDLWPESILAVGAMKKNFLLKLVDQIVIFLYRNADRVIVVTEAFKKRIHNYGVPIDRIHIVKNGVHLHNFTNTGKDSEILQKYNLEDKFVVAYIGTHGMAHGLDFILDAAAEIKQDDIQFLFVGEGAMKSRLEKQAETLGLSNVILLPGIPKSEVIRYISVSDVALIPLKRRDTFKKVLPSKIFENAAMGKPILLGVEGEAQELIEYYKAGRCFVPEDKEDFINNLLVMFHEKDKYSSYQEACLELANNFDRKKLAMTMYTIIKDLVRNNSISEVSIPTAIKK